MNMAHFTRASFKISLSNQADNEISLQHLCDAESKLKQLNYEL